MVDLDKSKTVCHKKELILSSGQHKIELYENGSTINTQNTLYYVVEISLLNE